MTKTRVAILIWAGALITHTLSAATLTPDSLTSPFGVQPSAALTVTAGVSQPFFSDLSGLSYPGPTIVGLLADLQAFDSLGNSIAVFSVTGVTVMQGISTLSPALDTFSLVVPITYASTLNPLNQVTVNRGDYNLGFIFNSDPSFQYSYTLTVTGVPDNGFLMYNDVEGAAAPEPALWLPLGVVLAFALCRCARGRRLKLL